MSYITRNIKEGINIHCISNNKFKTNLISVFITIPIKRETVTLNALIPAILKDGTQNLKTQEEINIKLEELYGATFDCGVDKIGDNQILKFYLETINDNYTLSHENMMKEALELILDIILNPYIKDESFNSKYLEMEKENVKNLIQGKIDNKDKYAFERCIEEMYKSKPYGIYKYGYVADLKNVNANELYHHYKELLNTAKIDIFISGEIDENETIKAIEENENVKKLNERKPQYIINNEQTEKKESVDIKTIQESKDITQGKLVIGMDIHCTEANSRYSVKLYNIILGESATSKLFQNVREKASLAYTARSNYVRQKQNIFIRCGIEIDKYDEALNIIKEQIEDMKQGNFTEKDLKDAKQYMFSGLKAIEDEQSSEIVYYFGEELTGKFISFEEYAKNLERVTKEDIIKIAKTIEINTIYFLKN